VLEKQVYLSVKNKSVLGGTSLLMELQNQWIKHKIRNRWNVNFFNHVDRFYVKYHNLRKLSDVGLQSFKEIVYEGIKEDATKYIISLLISDREGEIIDRSLIKDCVELFEIMGMGTLCEYRADLEAPLLLSSRKYYNGKRQEWMLSDSTPEYMQKAEAALNAELLRITECLNQSSETKLLRIVEEELLEGVKTVLIESEGSGCRVLLENDKSDDLQRMFRLFSRIENGLKPIALIVESFILKSGNGIIAQRKARLDEAEKDKPEDNQFVTSLIELHMKSHEMIMTTFAGHALFQKALSNAFINIMNEDVGNHSNSELLSSYCDQILKSGGEKLSQGQIEETMDRVIQLFTYLRDKDLFADIYRHHMAKRLLSQRSASNDSEKLMIAKLKLQCGTNFTSKLEGMLTDLAVGMNQDKEFENKLREKQVKTEFNVQALTTGYWPTYTSLDVPLSPDLATCVDTFHAWYNNMHQKRKLTWILSEGTATVRASFGQKSYELQVTTLQAIALNAFNDNKTLSYTELSALLNLQDAILKPLLHSLSCGKYKIISKSPASNKINSLDTFCANKKFSSKLRKFRIPMASLGATHNKRRVEEDRSIAIEAAIVRIMKARKTLKHHELIGEVLSQLAFFKPSARVIKQRIEALIDREYLERSDKSTEVYNVSSTA
jgi:cullin 1